MRKTKSVQVSEVPAPNVKKLLSIPPSIDADMRVSAHALGFDDLDSFIIASITDKITSFKTNYTHRTTILYVFPNFNPQRKELKNDDNKNKNRFNGSSYI